MTKLEQLYNSIQNLKELGVQLPDKLIEETNRVEEEIIQKEVIPDGFNIGINVGEKAGQTVNHVHINLIPRYNGDVVDPSGGVRGVIPNKQKY